MSTRPPCHAKVAGHNDDVKLDATRSICNGDHHRIMFSAEIDQSYMENMSRMHFSSVLTQVHSSAMLVHQDPRGHPKMSTDFCNNGIRFARECVVVTESKTSVETKIPSCIRDEILQAESVDFMSSEIDVASQMFRGPGSRPHTIPHAGTTDNSEYIINNYQCYQTTATLTKSLL